MLAMFAKSKLGSSGQALPKGDYGVASTRCSIRHLYDVISKFDERKKQLVRSIGFRLIEGCQFG